MVPAYSHKIPRVPWYSGFSLLTLDFAYGIFTLSDQPFQIVRLSMFALCESSTPLYISIYRFGLFPFRSPLLRKSFLYFLFLRVLRCFSSPGSLSIHYLFMYEYLLCSRWVPPFGYLRINVHVQLPVAFRSLSRPSSAPSAKASTLRPS